ncbi:putative short-chain dehydrogenase [Annulohypoxylon truncatum]|uniref:putative short-chain dehydrogenase n=1 Tax=Annulohypoxylon truncatum TaxID=327061 RepID=UPI0020074756|nr:putative short-chain dehydrogenase [Annulohypoxylon truncatum]KAI1206277.1 putative short-chain dehydrogenase [Annulohypoxylon truncatum]
MASPRGTIFLTGANGGLGCGIVSKIISTPELAGHHGIYAVRNASSAAALKSTLRKAPTSHTYDIISLELYKLANVREVVDAINSRVAKGKVPPIRALILNAGYNDLGHESFTEEGFETSFVANYLGHWLLTLKLLQSMDAENGRVVVVSSNSYDVNHPVHNIDGYYKEEKWKVFFREDNIDAIAKGTWSSNKDDLPRKAGTRRYGVAKMCAVMMVLELQRRLDADPALKGISLVTIDPGSMGTGLTRRGSWFIRTILFPMIVPLLAPLLTWLNPNGDVRTVSKSSNDVVEAAFETGPRLRGKYLNGSELQEIVPEALDAKKRAMVWRDSVKYTNLTEQDTPLINWK